MTGLDVRVGYPNEHLGKSKVDIIKSPMFATSVGLVLCGYKALDDRENRIVETQSTKGHVKKLTKNSTESIWKSILDKTKGILIDDIEDKG
jgi:cell division protein FtsA